MSELTLHTGLMGEETLIHIDWFDHNNVRQKTELKIKVKDQDKPRELEILANNVRIARIPPRDL